MTTKQEINKENILKLIESPEQFVKWLNNFNTIQQVGWERCWFKCPVHNYLVDKLELEGSKIKVWHKTILYRVNEDECWIFHENLDKFLKINRRDKLSWMQPFRKPGAGMLEYITQYFNGKFGDIEFIGDDYEKDLLAAQSAGIPFKHVWEIVRKSS
ncbi:hypothetical protein CAL7716_102420 (plasmid) [Calothrix sp. PCC 7716]|nr:hypothetical protein CAL7716_102420 [Calothrix sp. PCC 7716]